MSAMPSEGPQMTPAAAVDAGWQVRRCLTLIQAEELLDYLEASGVKQREVKIELTGVTVRWRAE